MDLDNSNSPAYSLMLLKNLRGNLPQQTTYIGASCYQQSSALTVANISNWNSINSVTQWILATGDYTNPCRNLGFAQDFMQNNMNLQTINTSRGVYLDGYIDTTFKISRLKINWNTYFTNLQALIISDDHWSREDLSSLTHLSLFAISAASLHHSFNPTNNPLVPIPVSVLDNIINQIAAGAGQNVINGTINLNSAGTDRSSVSDASFNLLKSKGWTIVINNLTE